ncbi:MAG TPA: hypothetical protein VHC43_02230 [Mycobacteriales bacterium]|nr:hypothetical protein [Mycobacteriales bacterium]
MTSLRVSIRGRGRPLAFLAAVGLAVFGLVGAGSASAGGPPGPPNYQYSSAVTAVGVQVALQRNPDFSSLPDPFDAEAPHSEAKLDSFGTSVADGHVVDLNGLGGVAGLVCLAAGPAACNAIPIGTVTAGLIPTFPPPDPVDAHASYPAHQTAKAPTIGKTAAQLAVDQSGFSLDVGASDAQAHQYDAATSAREQNLQIAGVLTIGSARTSTTQTATADGLTTTAIAHLSDIALGGTALTIGGMTTTSTVVSRPGKAAQDTTSTMLTDVKAAGLDATIDASGVHVGKNGLPGNVVAEVQKFVNQLFKAGGFKVALATVSHTDDSNGHTVAADGLVITWDHLVKGTQPITIAPPQGLPCPQIIPPGAGLDPCSGVSFTLDGSYHGQIALGQVGVVSMAQPGVSTGPTTPGGGPTIAPSPGGQVSSTGGGPPLSTGPQSVTSTGSSPGPAPIVAAPGRTVADQLGGVSHRLFWFFPLFALGALALIGRFWVPARLPGPK